MVCNRYRGLGQRSLVRFVHLGVICSLTRDLVSSLSSVGVRCIGRTAKRSSKTGTYACKNESITRTHSFLTIEKWVQTQVHILLMVLTLQPLAALSIRDVRIYRQERVQGPNTNSDLGAFEVRSFISRVSWLQSRYQVRHIVTSTVLLLKVCLKGISSRKGSRRH